MNTIEDLKLRIRLLQEELSTAIEEGDLNEAHRLEYRIDELQNQLFRLKTTEA
jgi:hypothetical protein